MPIITGLDRQQIRFSSLEDAISSDNDVRFIDAFVEKLDLGKLGVTSLSKTEKLKSGRASYLSARQMVREVLSECSICALC